MNKVIIIFIFLMLMISQACTPGKTAIREGDDWPHFGKDNKNSGITAERLVFPLYKTWEYAAPAPTPAWPQPAKADFYHEIPKLAPLVIYDRAYHVTITGSRLYFASSANNSVYCLDTASGKTMWRFFTDGPNRTAPALYNGKVYFGSDDGNLYCLDGKTGKELWRYKATKQERKIMGNGRMISVCPVRTGAVIQDGIVYFAAGLLPMEEVYVIALNAADGSVEWKKRQDETAPQGYPVVSESTFYIPNSRTRPFTFDLKSGEQTGKYNAGPGGDFIALTGKELLYGIDHFGDITAEDFLTAASVGHRLIASGDICYVTTDFRLTAIDRNNYSTLLKQKTALKENEAKAMGELKKLRERYKSLKGTKRDGVETELEEKIDEILNLGEALKELKGKEFTWEHPVVNPCSMILTKNAVIVGEAGKVSAFSVADGQRTWSQTVNGRPYGLAVSRGRLFVSTDKGNISCFDTVKREPVGAAGDKNKVFKSTKFHEEKAERILQITGIRKGYCLVLGCNNGGLARELATHSELTIIGVAEDGEKVRQVRERLDNAGLYGKRITVFQGKLADLEFTDYFANLVVSERAPEPEVAEVLKSDVFRLLRPGNGTAILGQKKLRRPHLEQAGEWTHLYADTANTASGGDKLVHDNLTPQWFGEPGPRDMADRHHRAVAPLYKNGIVYIPGYSRIIAADAYNGTLLWEKMLSSFRRLGIFRDAGNMALTDKILYIALESRCIGLDPETGEQVRTFVLPQLVKERTSFWGYLAYEEGGLFGSGRKPRATFNSMSKQDDEELWGDFQRSVTSDYLFRTDPVTGEMHWSYMQGVIVNPTITIGGGNIYFIENSSREALADEDGLMKPEIFLDKAEMTALDLRTGEVKWKKPFSIGRMRHSLFLSYADGMLIAVSSRNKDNFVWYDIYGFDAATGERVWHGEQNNEKAIRGEHGEQHLHPALVGGRVYAEPYAYDIKTGEQMKGWKMVRNGHGCGTISASENNLFFRADNPSLCNLRINEDEKTRRINRVNRPGCWINIIAVGGLVLIPEASSGCSCHFPLQTSMAYLPRDKELEVGVQPARRVINGSRTVALKVETGTADIYYTLDSSEPTRDSMLYTTPFGISKSVTLKALAFKNGKNGRVLEKRIPVYTGLGKDVELRTSYNAGDGKDVLTDGERGIPDRRDTRWLGFKKNDADVVIDLGETIAITKISASFLQLQGSRIFLPVQVEFSVSEDGKAFHTTAQTEKRLPGKNIIASVKEFSRVLKDMKARYVRVKAKNTGVCPEWHGAAGYSAWIYIDEIIID